MAEDHEKKVLEELVLIRWLLIFMSLCVGLIAVVFFLAILK